MPLFLKIASKFYGARIVRTACYFKGMSDYLYLKEQKMAERIIDKYLKRIAGLALKKGYNGFPYTPPEGEITVDGDRVPYRIDTKLGSKQFNVVIFPGGEEKKHGLSLAALGTVFAKYIRIVLDDIEEKIRLLPDVTYVADSLGPETFLKALKYLKETRNQEAAAGTLGIMFPTNKEILPIVGEVEVHHALSVRSEPEQDTSRVISAVAENSLHRLSPSLFQKAYVLSSVLPFFKHGSLFEAIQGCDREYSSLAGLDIAQELMDRYARLKNCGTFEQALEKRFGKISLLTKKDQEQFINNSRSIFENMQRERFDIYRGIFLNVFGSFRVWNEDFTNFLAEIRTSRKKENTGEFIEKIVRRINVFSNEAGALRNIVNRCLDFELIVSLPAALGGGEARYGVPYPSTTLPPYKLLNMENLVKEAMRYARFLDLADGVNDKVNNTLHGTANAVMQGFDRVFNDIIEKMASGRNAVLVSIMKGENTSPRVRKQKTYSEEHWLKEFSNAISRGTQTITDIFNQGNGRELHLGSKKHSINIKAGSTELYARFTTVNTGSFQNPAIYLEGCPAIYDQTEKEFVLGTDQFRGPEDKIAAIKEFVDQNPGSELSLLLKERPSQLIKSVKESFQEYADNVRDDIKSQINQEKESFYKAFEENFPEDLFEDYCTGPAN